MKSLFRTFLVVVTVSLPIAGYADEITTPPSNEAPSTSSSPIPQITTSPFEKGRDAFKRGDYVTAHRMLLPFAERGHAEAQSILGYLYEMGKGVPKDVSEAYRWYRRGAEQGEKWGQYSLGRIFVDGKVVPKDNAKAVRWFQKSAEQGYPDAQFALALMYKYGSGVPKNYTQAYKWYDLTILNSDQAGLLPDAVSQRDKIAKQMTPAQITEAQKQAREWERGRQSLTSASPVPKVKPTLKNTSPAKTRSRNGYEVFLSCEMNFLDKWWNIDASPGETADAIQGACTAEKARWVDQWAGNPEAAQTSKLVRMIRDTMLKRVEKRESNDRRMLITAIVKKRQQAMVPAPSTPPTPNHQRIARVQRHLNDLGYDPGPADGIFGSKTRAAIFAFEKREGLPATGMLSEGLESALRIAGSVASRKEATPSRPREKPVTPMLPDTLREVVDLGNFHALVIGNDAYRFLPQLRTAVKDVQAVAKLLESRYGFRVTTLINASRVETIQALDALRSKLTERDNLLIYYAGHGKLDRGSDRGFWLPVDAKEDSRANWLNNVTITDTLKAIRAKHVMVVADSCYSGTLTRDTRGVEVRLKKSEYVAKTHGKKSRTVLASGGLEPVSDSGGSGHSVFAKAFMDALRDNEGIIDGLDVFVYVRKQVQLNADQVPNYANIRYVGHEVGGDFLFTRKPDHQ